MTVNDVIKELSSIKQRDREREATIIVNGGTGSITEVSWIDTSDSMILIFETDGCLEEKV